MPCREINHPNLMPGYACCACSTFNGNQRSQCKACGHKRCDNPAVKRIATEEPGGVLIVTVRTDKSHTN
jgi:hypothetical protein